MRISVCTRTRKSRLLVGLGILAFLACVLGNVHRLLVQDARTEREAITAITAAGGQVFYDWQNPEGSSFPPRLDPTPLGSLLSRLGTDFRGRAVLVVFCAGPKNHPDDSVMPQIGRLHGLRELDFSPPVHDMVQLGNVSHPRVTDAGLVHLRGLTQLRRLELGWSGVRGPGLAHLCGLRQLRELGLLGLPLKDDDLVYLEGLTSLERLYLRSNLITDQGLAHLAGLTKLKLLDLSSVAITGTGFSHLTQMSQLEHLGLHSTRIETLSPIAHLTELTGVTLDYARVRDVDMTVIAGLRKLKFLSLASTPVGDPGLSHLAGLTDLEFLDLSGTRITDAGLGSLAGLARCKTLFVGRTRVTPAGIEALSKKCPRMRISHW